MKGIVIAAAVVMSAACQNTLERTPAASPRDERAADGRAADDWAARVAADDGVSLAYTDQGSGGPTLVFLHGWCGDRAHWREQVDVFAADQRVVTLDLGGHGASGARRDTWSLDVLAGDVVALAEALELADMVLVGHSMGAPVALLAAARLHGRVHGVVGIDSLHDVDFEIPGEMWERQVDAFKGDFGGTLDTFVEAMFHASASDELVEETKLAMSLTAPAVALPLFESFRAFDPAAALAGAGVPVRCINAAMPPTNVNGNRRHADFDAVTIADTGHYVMLEQPAALNQALRDILPTLRPMTASTVTALVPVMIVDEIEPQLDFWVERLGWTKTMEVPHENALGFVAFERDGAQVMYQTSASVAADMPSLGAEPFHTALYVKVTDLDAVARALEGCEVVFERRETFYGSVEVAFRDPAGNPVTFAEFPAAE